MVHGGRGFLDIGVCDRQSKTSDASYEWRLANVITSVASSAFCVKSSKGIYRRYPVGILYAIGQSRGDVGGP